MKQLLKNLAAAAALGVLSFSTAQARLVSDDSKKVLVVNVSYNANGTLREQTMTLGEYTMSTRYGFQVQGLYDTIEVLRFPADSQGGDAEAFPNIPSMGNLQGLDIATIQTRAEDHMRVHGYTWGEAPVTGAANPNMNRRVLNWMRRNGVSRAIFAFGQGVSVTTEFGPTNQTGKVYFTKVLNIDGRSYFGKPVVDADGGASQFVQATYYPLNPDLPLVDARLYDSAYFNNRPKGVLDYQVVDSNGAVLGSRFADAALGAFDSWRSADTSANLAQAQDFADCTFKSKEYRQVNGPNPNTGFVDGTLGKCYRNSAKAGFPTGDDLYRIMGRNNAKFSMLWLNHRPRIYSEEQADGFAADKAWMNITNRTLDYRVCSVQYQMSGTYDAEMEYEYSQWLFGLDGQRSLIRENTNIVRLNGLAFDIRKFSYRDVEEWQDVNRYPSNVYPINRAKAELLRGSQSNLIFDVLYPDILTPTNRVYSVNGSTYPNGGTPPAFTIVGNANAERKNVTNGSAVVRATCTPQGDLEFFAGKSSGTGNPAVVPMDHKYRVKTFNWAQSNPNRNTSTGTLVNSTCTSWSSCATRTPNNEGVFQDPYFSSRESQSIVPAVRATGAKPYNTAITNCNVPVTTSNGLSANGDYAAQYMYLSAEWMTTPATVGNAMTSYGTNCGTLFADLKPLADVETDTGLCPTGYRSQASLGYSDTYSCRYGTKTECTTSNDALGNPVTTCNTVEDRTVWTCSYSGYTSPCAQVATGSTCTAGTPKTAYRTAQGSPTPPGTNPTASTLCTTSTQKGLGFWVY